MSNSRIARASVIAVASVLALAGCMKMDIDLKLQSDDSVDGSMTVAVSKPIVEMSGQDADSLVEQMTDEMLASDQDLGEVRVEAYSDDEDFVGSTTHFTGAALDAFGSSDDESLSIVREGDEFVVSGAMDMTGEDVQGAEALASGMSVRVSITFPGAVSEHTGELEGNTVTWEPKVGERTEISARGSAVDGGGAGGLNVLLLAGLGALVLLVVIVIVVLVVRRNQSKTPAGYVSAEGLVSPDGASYPAPSTPQSFSPQSFSPQSFSPEPPASPIAAPDVPPVAPPASPAPPAPPASPAPPAPEQGNN